jgi:DNA invertase Pin-like site-specific DNA recombinase
MSSDAQEGSIPAQRTWARDAAKRERLRIVREFEDPGIAGGEVEHRPGLQAMLDYCDQRFADGDPVEVVVCWNPDRLSRADSLKTSAVLSRLKDAGVGQLLTNSDGRVDFDDVMHRVLFMLKQDLSRAGFCQNLAENVLRGKAERAKLGLWVGGRVPLGYASEGGRLVPDPATAPVVQWLFSAYASGEYTLRMLGEELQRRDVPPYKERRRRAQGLPPGRVVWVPSALTDLLRNPAYLGHIVWNDIHQGKYARLTGGAIGKDDSAKRREQTRRREGRRRLPAVKNDDQDRVEVANAHVPLIDAALFAAVGKRLAFNQQRTTPVRGAGPWLLSGLLRCGCCGGRMHGQNGTLRTGGTRNYYLCEAARRGTGCPCKKRVRQDEVLAEILAEVRERFADGKALAALRRQVEKLVGRCKAEVAAERVRLQGRLQELDGDIARGIDNLARLPPDLLDDVAKKVQAWRGQRDDVARQLETLAASDGLSEDTADRVEEAVRQVENLHLAVKKDPAALRAALAAVVGSVIVHIEPAERRQDLKVTAIEVRMADGLVSLFTSKI